MVKETGELEQTVQSFQHALDRMEGGVQNIALGQLRALASSEHATLKHDLEVIDTLLKAYDKDKKPADIEDTATGGYFGRDKREFELLKFYPLNLFGNGTVVNHLGSIRGRSVNFKIVSDYTQEPTPFFRQLEELAKTYLNEAFSIKADIFRKEDFRGVYDGLAEIEDEMEGYMNEHGLSKAEASDDDGYQKLVHEFEAKERKVQQAFIDAEWNKRDRIITLLEQIKTLYESTINFVEQVVEGYKPKKNS